jgi:hypothetical protein
VSSVQHSSPRKFASSFGRPRLLRQTCLSPKSSLSGLRPILRLGQSEERSIPHNSYWKYSARFLPCIVWYNRRMARLLRLLITSTTTTTTARISGWRSKLPTTERQQYKRHSRKTLSRCRALVVCIIATTSRRDFTQDGSCPFEELREQRARIWSFTHFVTTLAAFHLLTPSVNRLSRVIAASFNR